MDGADRGRDGDEVGRLLPQRGALAKFGSRALAGTDLDGVLTEGARRCAEGLGVPFAKVLEHRPGRGDLLVRAGVGWKPGVVGRALARADTGNPGGKAFVTGQPVIVPDLGACEGMDLPSIYPEHGIVSTANVPIGGGPGEAPYGVLEVDAPEPRGFGPHDLDFLQGYANVIASAVRAESDARAALLREQQHRVRNNLMAVTAMLRDGERDATTPDSRARFGEVRGRVFALASLYDHLLGAGLSADGASLRDYLAALCRGARDFYDFAAPGIGLAFEADDGAVVLGIDACTAVGIVVNELVANAAEHAFAAAGGGRIVVRLGPDGHGGVEVSVEDDGVGVPPGAEGGGVGLGVARRLVEQIGGSLALRSRPGHTAWAIALPVTA
jgi:two-component sensor histidine kinase